MNTSNTLRWAIVIGLAFVLYSVICQANQLSLQMYSLRSLAGRILIFLICVICSQAVWGGRIKAVGHRVIEGERSH
jgi:hypothetical protein